MSEERTALPIARAGLFAGPALFALVLLLPAAAGMSEEARRVAALTC